MRQRFFTRIDFQTHPGACHLFNVCLRKLLIFHFQHVLNQYVDNLRLHFEIGNQRFNQILVAAADLHAMLQVLQKANRWKTIGIFVFLGMKFRLTAAHLFFQLFHVKRIGFQIHTLGNQLAHGNLIDAVNRR